MWSTVTWTIARAGGLTALLLLTLAVAAGLAMSLRWQSAHKWPRLINNELHNFLTLLATIFVVVHVVAVWLDPYTKFGWNDILIPFISSYRPIYVALGIIGVYLGIAIGISTLLRKYIGYTMWRRLHVFTLLIYALAVIHGIFSGSDTTSWWGISI
jgi:predicted ferric reductase